ncbi:TOMM precursor leader peptide-binding protein [Streptomyces roseirectus]|uniref:TOMM leader peptide-binding protein n=1 Tax=Streptomyces roseirectus TaxID=2768066 RepID=A0A7H0IC18_9ACTN|nr:TOMM precursor leader peptide-binding protein [Streptomyces roseirectus]QNP70334.1 TOMM precursor leader peptide-binding protein [Streptomyces roseirectus]
MHPRVKPALRRGWRDLRTVQFGMTPAHALTLGPLDSATEGFLELLDGTRGLPLLREEARRRDLSEGHVDGLVRGLAGAGLLDDARGGGPDADALRHRGEVLERLAPDLAALSLLTPEPGEAMRLLAARRRARVRVRGAGRVGAVLAALLSGAGVGTVEVSDEGRVEPGDVSPGGLPAAAVGEPRREAARRAVRAASPDRPPSRESGPDPGFTLVILAPRDDVGVYAPDPAVAEPLIASGTPHLYAGVVEATGIVGPLVLPGETACAGCLQHARSDADPAWPRLLAQWRSGHRRRVPPCDLALAATVAGLAAAHALAFLDGHTPPARGTRWEVSAPALQWQARPLTPHPACACGAASVPDALAEPSPTVEEHPEDNARPHETMAGQRHSNESRSPANAARPVGTWRAHV